MTEPRASDVLGLVMVAVSLVFLVLYTLQYNDAIVLAQREQHHYVKAPLSTTALRTAVPPAALPNPELWPGSSGAVTAPCQPVDFGLDQIYFINMDHRQDRLAQITGELDRMGVSRSKVTRIPGVKDRFGALGCSKAHRNALLDCQRHGYKNCLILEDDFVFKQSPAATWEQLNRFFRLPLVWDVVMWASVTCVWEKTQVDFLVRVHDAQTTSGYMVQAGFLDRLLQNVNAGIDRLEASNPPHNTDGAACIDQYWKTLQPISQWFAFHPMMGYQQDGLSDIEHRVTSYQDKAELQAASHFYQYVIFIRTSQSRRGTNNEQLTQLKTWSQNHPVCYYRYLGDPQLTTEFALNESERILTLRCPDDYIHRCHRVGLLLQALRCLLQFNRSWQSLRGALWIDDDTVLTLSALYPWLEAHVSQRYWGHVVHPKLTSDHLKSPYDGHVEVRSSVSRYPALLQYSLELPLVPYCASTAFFMTTDLMLQAADQMDLFPPFPANAEALQPYQHTLPDGRILLNTHLRVIPEVSLGVAASRNGVSPVHVDMRQIIRS